MPLRINRDRSHETSTVDCEICKLWTDIDGNAIRRKAFWIGQFEDGQTVLICNNCKSQGFKVIGTYRESNNLSRFNYIHQEGVITEYLIRGKYETHSCENRETAQLAVREMIRRGIPIDSIRKRGNDGIRIAMSDSVRQCFVINAMRSIEGN